MDTSLFEKFQKFLVMYEKFEIILDMLEQLQKFLAFKPHAMSTLSNKSFTSFSKWILDSGIGSVDTPSVALSDVYYILNLTMNLASVLKCCDA
ncbi:hypothetical protein Tco_1238285 [Tanacetum coccineum]